MPKDSFQAVGGDIAGEAASDLGQDLADFVSKVAREELERRHPGGVAETSSTASAFPGAISSEDLDAQVPEGILPPAGVTE